MIKAKKSLGQNFLVDTYILQTIVNSININNKTILEIGPGTGNLTNYILDKNPKEVFVIEKDDELANNLRNKFTNKLNIINDDVLNVDESSLFREKVIVFGNLIDAEINNGSKDYDLNFIRDHVEKLTC